MTTHARAASILATALVCLCSRGQSAPANSSATVPPADIKVDVVGTVHYSGAGSLHHSMRDLGQRTVIWLAPVGAQPLALPPASFTMTQKNKAFHPRLLVVPVGSSVSFPNADPYFHNVFSLFNGRRFDLGLYQSGQARTIAFSREGVSYVFCNIHPEMNAVIISLKTPYYTSPDAEGAVALRGVAEGDYRLEVWSEMAGPETLRSLSRTVRIDVNHATLGTIEIKAFSPRFDDHLNKFGQPYDTHTVPPSY
jgi:hypothetical protein